MLPLCKHTFQRLAGLSIAFLLLCLWMTTAVSQPLSAFKNGRIFTFSSDNNYWLQMQDEQGFIWGYSREKEVVRFDGHSYHAFQADPNDSTAIQPTSSNSFSIFPAREGKVWVLMKDGPSRYDPVTGQFEHFHQRVWEVDSVGPWSYNRILEDDKGNIWFGGSRGIYLMDTKTGEIKRRKRSQHIRMLFADGDDVWTWQGAPSGPPYFIKTDADSFTINSLIVLEVPDYEVLNQPYMYDSFRALPLPYREHEFILLMAGELHYFNAQTEEMRLLPAPLDENEWIFSIYSDGSTLIAGTNKHRILEYHPEPESFSTFLEWEANGLEYDPVLHLFTTKEGILWITTAKRTFQVLTAASPFWQLLQPSNMRKTFAAARHQFLVPYQGKVYFNTENGLVPALSKPDLDTIPLEFTEDDFRIPSHYERTNTLQWAKEQSGFLFTENKQDHTLWLLLYQFPSGIKLFQFDSLGRKRYQYACTGRNDTCFQDHMGSITSDSKGYLWIEGWVVVSRFDPSDQSFFNLRYRKREINALNHTNPLALLVDSQDDIWIGYTSRGISRYEPDRDTFYHYTHVPSDSNSLISSLRVTDLLEDRNGNIWIASVGGLSKWDRSTKRFTRYGKKQGLPSLSIQSMNEGAGGNLWIIAGQKLTLYDPDKNRFYNFGPKDGFTLPVGTRFNVCQDQEGHLFYATDQGGVYFNTKDVSVDERVPDLVFTDLIVDNQPVKPEPGDGLLQQNISYTSQVELPFQYNGFTIRYTALEFLFPKEISYAIRLEGYDDTWRHVGAQREATYSNLSPGNYLLQVKCYNRHGKESAPLDLQITILPPWYRTYWAWVLWILLGASGLYTVYRYLLRRQLKVAEEKRQVELNAVKARLYTNITHEFRTPLTLINGTADTLQRKADFEVRTGLQKIKRHGRQLLDLVNQLLDLSKLESGSLRVHWEQGDVVVFLQYLLNSFHTLAEKKGITLGFSASMDTLLMDYDPVKLRQVMTNLLSNAIKFAGEEGRVRVEVAKEENQLQIQVSDNGIGIAPDQLELIFDRFYQVDSTSTRKGEGTGIGLTLTRELIKLMNGSIAVSSEPGRGSRFTIHLPITRNAELSEQKVPPPNVEATAEDRLEVATGAINQNQEKPVLLIIEDHIELMDYLASLLESQYHLLKASDGQSGLETARKQLPDLVISDVMMPGMDGFQVCKHLKEDLQTCHIPIILLTARADTESRLEGIEQGADAYLSKPFEEKELQTLLRKLFESRNKLKEYYTSDQFIFSTGKPSSSQDERFLQTLLQHIEEHLSNPDFTAEELAGLLFMSYHTCLAKVKALTGMGVKEYIQYIRLQKAKLWLRQYPDRPVAQIAIDAGFSSPQYFSRRFKRVTGVSPGKYRIGQK